MATWALPRIDDGTTPVHPGEVWLVSGATRGSRREFVAILAEVSGALFATVTVTSRPDSAFVSPVDLDGADASGPLFASEHLRLIARADLRLRAGVLGTRGTRALSLAAQTRPDEPGPLAA